MSNEVTVIKGTNGAVPTGELQQESNAHLVVQPEPARLTPEGLPRLSIPPIPNEILNEMLCAIFTKFRLEDVTHLQVEGIKQLWFNYQREMDLVMNHDVIDVLMPCQEGRFINPETTRSLDAQDYEWRLWVSTKHSEGNHEDARNQVKDYGLSPLVLFLDNDLELPPHALKTMVHFLAQPENEKVACIVLHRIEDGDDIHWGEYDGTADYPEHVGMSCNLWRREVLEQMTFTKRGSCECKAMCEDLRANGYEIGVLRGLTCKHLKSKLPA